MSELNQWEKALKALCKYRDTRRALEAKGFRFLSPEIQSVYRDGLAALDTAYRRNPAQWETPQYEENRALVTRIWLGREPLSLQST